MRFGIQYAERSLFHSLRFVVFFSLWFHDFIVEKWIPIQQHHQLVKHILRLLLPMCDLRLLFLFSFRFFFSFVFLLSQIFQFIHAVLLLLFVHILFIKHIRSFGRLFCWMFEILSSISQPSLWCRLNCCVAMCNSWNYIIRNRSHTHNISLDFLSIVRIYCCLFTAYEPANFPNFRFHQIFFFAHLLFNIHFAREINRCAALLHSTFSVWTY